MKKKAANTALLVLSVLVAVISVGVAVASHFTPVYIGTVSDFPPPYTPPKEIEECHVFDTNKGYNWETPPYGGKRVVYEEGWTGQAHRVLVLDVDKLSIPRIKLVFLMRESFGMGCPENRQQIENG